MTTPCELSQQVIENGFYSLRASRFNPVRKNELYLSLRCYFSIWFNRAFLKRFIDFLRVRKIFRQPAIHHKLAVCDEPLEFGIRQIAHPCVGYCFRFPRSRQSWMSFTPVLTEAADQRRRDLPLRFGHELDPRFSALARLQRPAQERDDAPRRAVAALKCARRRRSQRRLLPLR